MDRTARVAGAALSRRAALGGALAAIAGVAGLAGCSGRQASPADELTVRRWSAARPFLLGSRGGSRDWPEQTVYGFTQAAAVPAIQAMEVVVRLTADGVPVCCADASTLRVTGRDLIVAEESWPTLETLQVQAGQTRDSGQPPQPLARLEEILEQFADRFVLVVEPQGEQTAPRVMARLAALPAPQRLVWKQPINSTRFGEAKRHGFATWGYVLDEPAHTGANLPRLARSPDLDLIGASYTKLPLARKVLDVARQNGTPAVAWNVASRVDAVAALRLGFAGLSTPAIREAVGWVLTR